MQGTIIMHADIIYACTCIYRFDKRILLYNIVYSASVILYKHRYHYMFIYNYVDWEYI